MLRLFNDPEGPNLVVVIGMALILYFLSLAVQSFIHSVAGLKKLLLAISAQVVIAAGFYLLLA
jgi:hypothetical protein